MLSEFLNSGSCKTTNKYERMRRLIMYSRMSYKEREVAATIAVETVFEKYRCPDRRCQYPFEPDPLGYCWSWANFVDDGQIKGEGFPEFCKTCELWNPNAYKEASDKDKGE